MADTQPLQTPADYDMTIAMTCAYVNDVAGDMITQWMQNCPPENEFQWDPANSCPVTNGWLPLSDFAFAGPMWSTFTWDGQTYSEPFAIAALAPDGRVYLSFRGSRTSEDWIMDFEFKLVPYTPPAGSAPGAEVEEGFYAVFNGFGLAGDASPVAALAGRLGLATVPETLVVTGHSLGSTLSTLMVPLLAADASDNMTLLHYNSASPRVGNGDFASYYEGLGVDTYRLVNVYDLIPQLPPTWLGYTTVGEQASYGADYSTEAEKHDACCSYAYALWNPADPFNPDMATCQTEEGAAVTFG